LYWLMGDVIEVNGMTDTVAHERIEVEDIGVATLRFANGAIGVIEATTAAWPGLLKKTEIHGTQGTAIIEQDDIVRWEFEHEDPADSKIREQFRPGSANTGGAADPKAISHVGHRDQLQDFVRSIQDGTAPMADGIDGRKSVEIILAIYQAAWTKQTVTLPLPGDPVRPA
jgi:predicted dehydrogenase